MHPQRGIKQELLFHAFFSYSGGRFCGKLAVWPVRAMLPTGHQRE